MLIARHKSTAENMRVCENELYVDGGVRRLIKNGFFERDKLVRSDAKGVRTNHRAMMAKALNMDIHRRSRS